MDLAWDVEAGGGRRERATDGVRLQEDSWRDYALVKAEGGRAVDGKR